MLATWENSHGGTLTTADYLASGRIRDAVTRTAEAAYDTLTDKEKQLARRLFLRLVHVADDAPPTRAALPLGELRDWDPDAGHVLDVFVGERMITVDADSARITHDALLAAWPRLRGWIDAGQAGLITRRRITDAARAWEGAGREATWLWRGGQLSIATEWAGDPANHGTMTKAASDFVNASSQSERARQRSDRRRTRRLQVIVAILAVLVLVVGVSAGYALTQRRDAVAAEADATSRQLAVEAQELRGQDPAVAAQLSVAAYHVARTPQATAALLESSGVPYGARVVDTDGGIAQWTALSPDHSVMAVAAADGTLKLWNMGSPAHPVLVDTLVTANGDEPLYVTAFSPDGKVLAAAGAGEVVKLWNVSDPAHPVALPELAGPTSTIYSVAFSPDGREVAAGSNDTNAWLWRFSNADAPTGGTGTPLAGATAAVNSVAFGVDGKVLAAGSADTKIRLWDLAKSGKAVLAATLTGPAEVVSGVAFSPQGELAATSHDHKVWLWKVSYGTVTTTVKGAKGKPDKQVKVTGVQAAADGTLSQATGWTNAVSFSPDGSMLAAGTADASVLVWTVATRALAAAIPAPQPVTSVTWDGADRIASSDADGTVTIWTLPAPQIQAGNQSTVVAYSPDGKTIAVGGQTSVQLWDAASHVLIATYPVPAAAGGINGLAYSPDGTLLAVPYSNSTVAILSGQSLTPVGVPFRVTAHGFAESVAFSPDGKVLATGSDDGSVRLFSIADPAHPVLLAKAKDSGNYVYTVAFAPDGKTVAAASTDNDTRLWDVTNPSAPQLESTLGGLQSYAIGLAFTPDSKTLAVSSADKTVHLWNVANPSAAVQIGTPLTGLTGYVWAAAISPDGKTLAVGLTTGTVWLWNIAKQASPVLMGTLTGPAGHVYSVAFNPAGTQLAASSDDGTVFTWDVSPAAAVTGVCSDLGQPLTAAEWAAYAPGVPYKAPCS
jgi:WD40 repeat protein